MQPAPLRTLFRVLVIGTFVGAVCVTVLAGWRAYFLFGTSIPAPADDEIVVPAAFVGQLTMHPKKSATDPLPETVTVDGPTYYRGGFRAGWTRCQEDYRSGTFNPQITRDEVVRDDESDMFYAARQDGYVACVAEIRRRTGR